MVLGVRGTDGFSTTFRIWREALTGGNAACADYATNARIPTADFVRFDERENATTVSCGLGSGCIGSALPTFPTTATVGEVGGRLPPFRDRAAHATK
jgi:hypothetical protein